ncbi:unnamed protein product [Adineta steineri]|uniref:Uncharacterized protein n=1 Tax=Adineta steineri TaxID=433720 RepID=A0A815U8C2_9BILA|nr:unnamed protein product [Adineta steineri]
MPPKRSKTSDINRELSVETDKIGKEIKDASIDAKRQIKQVESKASKALEQGATKDAKNALDKTGDEIKYKANQVKDTFVDNTSTAKAKLNEGVENVKDDIGRGKQSSV